MEENNNNTNENSNHSEEPKTTPEEPQTPQTPQEPKQSIVQEPHLGKRAKTEFKKLSSNKIFWLALGIIGIALVIMFFNRGVSGNVSADFAANAVLEFANAQGANAELEGVEEEDDFYKVALTIQGQTLPVYVTKDGKYFTSSLIPLSDVPNNANTNQQQQQTQTQTVYSEEDLPKIKEFSQCLAEKGVKIYGADWCGWTKKFVETLGGADTIAPIYVECTTKADECSEAGVTGYPTTQINGETYTGARTIEGLAQATGCTAPELEGSVQQAATDSSAGNC